MLCSPSAFPFLGSSCASSSPLLTHLMSQNPVGDSGVVIAVAAAVVLGLVALDWNQKGGNCAVGSTVASVGSAAYIWQHWQQHEDFSRLQQCRPGHPPT
jgi:hypothetical protein